MFNSLNKNNKVINHSGRSYFSETLQVNGDVNSSGAIDVSGLIIGNVFAKEMTLLETGSVRGILEITKIEINGHVDGKITADEVILGKNAVIKGDIFFRNYLKAEEGADIDGYIKRIDNGKNKVEEEVDVEQIIERPIKKPKLVPRPQKEAV